MANAVWTCYTWPLENTSGELGTNHHYSIWDLLDGQNLYDSFPNGWIQKKNSNTMILDGIYMYDSWVPRKMGYTPNKLHFCLV